MIKSQVWKSEVSGPGAAVLYKEIHNLLACQERSHSGLVRRFAKPLKGKPFRGFDSHPLRHRGVAQLVEHSSPKRVVAGSIPVSPAKLLNVQGSGVFILLVSHYPICFCPARSGWSPGSSRSPSFMRASLVTCLHRSAGAQRARRSRARRRGSGPGLRIERCAPPVGNIFLRRSGR
jgi:hypothetical protein